MQSNGDFMNWMFIQLRASEAELMASGAELRDLRAELRASGVGIGASASQLHSRVLTWQHPVSTHSMPGAFTSPLPKR